MKIAIIDKCPSKNDYSKYFDFEYDLFHMSSVPLSKLLKKDVDLDIDTDLYDYIILVGSEAAKHFAGVSSITNYSGQLVGEKFLCLTNPSILVFKPEGRVTFNESVAKIKKFVSGELKPTIDDGLWEGISDTDRAKEYLVEVLNQTESKYVAIDTEGTALYPRDGYVLGVSICYRFKYSKYILTDIMDDECIELLQKIIDKFEIVMHNSKYDLKMMEYHLHVKFNRDRLHDTILLAYILDENGSLGLKDLALKYTNFGEYDRELQEFIAEYCNKHGILRADFTWDLIPFEIIYIYASKDPAVTLEIFNKFYPIVCKNAKFLDVYTKILLPGTLFLHDMEEVGIPIDVERMELADKFLEINIEEAKQNIYKHEEVKQFELDHGKIFNPNSVQQLRIVLFDYLKLTPTGKLTATGALSTDAEVLEELSEEHQLPKDILVVRQLEKIRNTYISKILPELDRDGRIRTNFNLIFTTSGRLSSSGKFNAQQIPRDNPIVKGCIKAPKGYKIISQDLQTGEMYYAAVLSGDANLQSVFKTGEDFHSSIAKMVFDLPCDAKDVKKLYPAMRQSAKAISFGILYGSGPKKVSDTVSKATGEHYSISRAKEDIDAYFGKFKKLKKWLDSRKEFIAANGFTYSHFGRKRRLENVFSEDKGLAAHEVRSGINAEIQSLCSDVNLLGAIDTHNELKEVGLDAKIFMLVHDSIVALVKDEQVDTYKEILKRNTQKDRGCSVPGCPIGVDQEVGEDYSFGKWDQYYIAEGNKLSRISDRKD